jgi:cyclophilin family peptidyl-prolyl cis-trans isomerase
MASARNAILIRALFALLLLCGLSSRSRADLDFNLDGKADIAFQSQANASLVYWDLNGPNYINGGSLPTPISPDWRLVDSGKMTSDNVPALLYQNRTTNQILYAYLNGATITGGTILAAVPATGYNLVGVGDVNGDGKPDLIFQNQTSGLIVFWFMNGTSYLGGAALTAVPGAGYHVVGVGDFNGDGYADLVLQNTTSNQIVFWFLNGTTFAGGVSMPIIPGSGYSVVGLGDVTNTGRPNLILQNQTSGQLVYWLLNGTTFAGGDLMTSPFSGDYKAVGIRSFYPRPAPVRIEKLAFSALYGTVRLRVRSLHDSTATVAVRVGSVASPSAHIAYVDTAAPDTGIGGAVDFQVPYGMAAGSQNVVVTVNGKDSPGLPVTVTNTNPFAVFTVENNTTLTFKQFVAELRADVAPQTAGNFVNLAMGRQPWQDPCNSNAVSSAPFYNGLTFHRVIPGFVMQGGDPYTRCLPETDGRIGTGGPGYTIPFEKTGLTHNDGALAMARASALDSGSSQFFIDNGPQHILDPTFDAQGNPASGYVVFGFVVENLANAKAITPTYDASGTTLVPGVVPDTMTSVIITGKIDGP